MGWSSGSQLMEEIIIALKDVGIGPLARLRFYRRIIPRFQDMDCDTLYECLNLDDAFADAMEVLEDK